MHKKFVRSSIVFGFISLLVGSILISLTSGSFTQNAYAVSYNFEDASRVIAGSTMYLDRDPFDGNHNYVYEHDGCKDDFSVDSWDSGENDGDDLVATLHKERYDSGENECKDDGEEEIKLTNRPARFVMGYVIDDETIFLPVSKDGTSGQLNYDVIFKTEDTSGEKEYIPEGSDGFDNGGIRLLYDGSPEDVARYQSQSCPGGVCANKSIDKDITLSVVAPDLEIYPSAPVDGNTGGGGSTADPAEADNSCEAAGDFAWIMCPVAFALSGAIEWTTTQVSRLLEVDRDRYTNDDLYGAWANIRNIALTVLILMMLVMVIATALNTQMFDAYTVKRALPRMVAAIMFIVLSWYLCIALIDIFNYAGSGIVGIMTAPFKQGGIELTDIFSAGIGTTITNWLGGTGLVIGIILIIVFFWSTILLFVGMAFLVLILRQLFVIVLMLLAPLAVLAWIFPGNDKLWKAWWGSFSKLLMMYPLIMALLAAGRIFAYLIQNGGGGSGAQGFGLDPLFALLAFTIPFGFIPFTFKTAGGLFATVSGMANDRSKGLFDRARKGRGEKAKRWASGNAFKGAPEGSLRSKFNTGSELAANARHFGGISSLRRPSTWASNIRGAVDENTFEHALEGADKLPGGKAFFGNDDLMMAGLEGGGDFAKTRAYLASSKANGGVGYKGKALDVALGQVMRMRKQMGGEAFSIAALAKLPGTGTAFEKEDIGKWHQQIAKHTHGDKSLQGTIIAAGKAGFRAAQRYEVSEAGFGDHMEAIARAERGEDASSITDFVVDKSYASGGPAAVVGSRNAKTAEMFAGAVDRDFRRAVASGDQRQVLRSMAAVASIQDQIGSAKRIVSDVISTEVIGKDVGGKSMLQRIDEVRLDPTLSAVFQEARKEYGASLASAAAGATAAAAGAASATTGGAPGGGAGPVAPGGGLPG